MYYLSIQIGVWKGFGIFVCVGIIIYGENGNSGVVMLMDFLVWRKLFI